MLATLIVVPHREMALPISKKTFRKCVPKWERPNISVVKNHKIGGIIIISIISFRILNYAHFNGPIRSHSLWTMHTLLAQTEVFLSRSGLFELINYFRIWLIANRLAGLLCSVEPLRRTINHEILSPPFSLSLSLFLSQKKKGSDTRTYPREKRSSRPGPWFPDCSKSQTGDKNYYFATRVDVWMIEI